MLKAIHASGDIVAAREKTIQVIEKLRALRLSPPEPVPRAAESNCKQCRKPSQDPQGRGYPGSNRRHGHHDFPETDGKSRIQ
jgi:hypothetical protein